MQSGHEFQRNFFNRHRSIEPIIRLFDELPHAYAFAKDLHSRFVYLNNANSSIYGASTCEKLLGKSDLDFHPATLAQAYIAEDQRVMRQLRASQNQLWLVPFLDGTSQWFSCTKTPMLCSSGDVIGVAGIMYPVETPEEQLMQFGRLQPAIQTIEKNFREQICLESVAANCGISTTHFNRMFQQYFHMSPTAYITKLRIQEAKAKLATTKETVSAIALSIGFYDQSHFARRFRNVTGMSPSEYRQSLKQTAGNAKTDC